MTTATVYATLVTDAYIDGLFARLIRRGYAVSPVNENLVASGPASALAVFDIEREIEDEDYEEIETEDADERDVFMADVTNCLNEMRARWHSIIIQVGEHTMWEASNIEALPTSALTPAASALLSDDEVFPDPRN